MSGERYMEQAGALAELQGGADAELIYEALRFYFWAAGEGMSPNADQDCLEPEEGFWRYSQRTGDELWETVAERYRRAHPEPSPTPLSKD